jgi:predicted nucleic acid-binding protein
MGADPLFLDTSLIVAASVDFHPANQAAVSYVSKLVREDTPLCISPQVCREFVGALTRKPIGGKTFAVKEALAALSTWHKTSIFLDENSATVGEWLRLVEKHEVRGKQVHDCNIVATMLVHGVKRLGTRNPADFERYDDQITIEHVLS